MFSRMRPRPSEATISVIAPRPRSGLNVTWSMAMQANPMASAATPAATTSGQPSCALSANARYAATVIIAPTAKFGNLSTPKSSVTASAGSVMMTPVMMPLKNVCTEIEAVQVFHSEHRVRRPAAAHAPSGEHDAGIRDAQRLARVLLHHEDAHAHGIHLLDLVEHRAHEERRQTGGRLVQHQHPGPHREGAGEGEHLALAAGEIPSLFLVVRSQLREQILGEPRA